jgi:uncharacterized protein YycO
MKYLSLFPVAVLAIALQAQPGVAASISSQTNVESGQTAASAVSVPAELIKSVNVKKARVGDKVVARITEDTKLPDGTDLPKGTKLVGTMTSVPGRSNSGPLTFDFDRAVLHSGQAVLVHTTLTSMEGQPAVASTDAASASTSATATPTSDTDDRTASVDSGTRMTLDVSSRRE